MASIFISHDAEDTTLAVLLKTFLESLLPNVSVFVSSGDLVGGDVWFEQLRQQLERASAIVAILTPRSKSNPWVLFEAGAGFCSKKTIPLIADGLTFDDSKPIGVGIRLGAPLKLLQGREYTPEGLASLVQDIVARIGARMPKLHGIDETIAQADDFLAKRREEREKATSQTAVAPAAPKYDPELLSQWQALHARAHRALVDRLGKARASFEIPPKERLEKMSFSELTEIADAVNVAIPMGIRFALAGTLLGATLPAPGDSTWKKMNARKRLEDAAREVVLLETGLWGNPLLMALMQEPRRNPQ